MQADYEVSYAGEGENEQMRNKRMTKAIQLTAKLPVYTYSKKTPITVCVSSEKGEDAAASAAKGKSLNGRECGGGLNKSVGEECEECCAICLQELMEGESVRILACEHTFHQQCCDEWLKVKGTCPLCIRVIYSIAPTRIGGGGQASTTSAQLSITMERESEGPSYTIAIQS